MKKIAFTLCSNNYLAHAKTLGDSLRATNPDVKFVIGLTDKLSPDVDYSFFDPFEILPYDQTGFPLLEELVVKYNIIEFNTAVKPFYFEALFNRYGENSLIYYLDPDIAVYSSFEEMHTLLKDNNFLVTPHITRPELTVTAHETTILNVGIYNLGFIGMRNSENTVLFLKWWQERLRDYCYVRYAQGLFVDQIWVNFIHLLFEKAVILRSPGYNMAYWNFYERVLLEEKGKYYVNEIKSPLIFFHFSGFNPLNATVFTKDKKSTFTAENRPDLIPLFNDYGARLLNNKYQLLKAVAPLLKFKPRKIKYNKRQRIGNSLKYRVNKCIKVIFDV